MSLYKHYSNIITYLSRGGNIDMSEEFKKRVKEICDSKNIDTTIVLKENKGEHSNDIK